MKGSFKRPECLSQATAYGGGSVMLWEDITAGMACILARFKSNQAFMGLA